jgi:hypothetical protein
MANRKETLLKEGTIRRFMKLAEIEPLSENFLDSYSLDEQGEEELEVADVEFPPEGEEEEVEVADVEEVPTEEAPEEMIQDLVTQIADVISDVTGVEVSVESEGGEPEEIEAMGDMEDIEAEEEVLAAAEPEEPGDELEEDQWKRDDDDDKKRQKYGGDKGDESRSRRDYMEEELEELEEIEVVDEDKLVQEIASRVARRLLRRK